MSLLTVKHVIKSLTTGMCCLVTMETASSITFALGQLTTERDTIFPSTYSEAPYQHSNHRNVRFGNSRDHFID